MASDLELALRFAPRIHFDTCETQHPRAIGYTVFRETKRSASFPGRLVEVPSGAAFTLEYAYYYDYDIEHMYDLEHIWVTVNPQGEVLEAQGSFHGKVLNLLGTALPGALPPAEGHVHAFCQPGKHAFLAAGELTRLYPRWNLCCGSGAGGPVLIGNPFCAAHSPTGEDLFRPTEADHAHSVRYLRERLSFTPSMIFVEQSLEKTLYMPWETLYGLIPGWIADECRRLSQYYGKE